MQTVSTSFITLVPILLRGNHRYSDGGVSGWNGDYRALKRHWHDFGGVCLEGMTFGVILGGGRCQSPRLGTSRNIN